MGGARAVIAALLLAGAGAAPSTGGAAEDASPAGHAPASTGAGSAVGAMGRVEPYGDIININAGTPDRLAQLLVHAGERVKKGQILGYLEEYDSRAADRETVAAQLAEAKAQLAATTVYDLASIDQAQIKLQQINEVSPLRIAAQSAEVQRLESMLTNDKDIAETDNGLARDNITSRRVRRDHLTAVQIDQARLTAASARLNELRAQFAVDQQSGEIEIRLTKARLERDKAAIPVASLERQLALAEARLREATLRAPIDGRILNIIAHAGEQVGQIDGAPVLSMGDTDHMRIVAEVYETDIRRVAIGDRAVITSPALAKPLTGRVAEIGNMIFKNDVLHTDPAARIDARIVQVRIDLDDPQAVANLSNLKVDVVIHNDAGTNAAVAGAAR